MDDAWDRVAPRLHGTATRDDILEAARAFAPDVLVLDCMMGAGFSAARQLGLPTAVLVHVLYSEYASGWGDQVMGASVPDLVATADRVLALVPPGFDAAVTVPPNTSYVGPIIRPESGSENGRQSPDLEMITRSGDPWILLSLSTTLQRQTEALPTMLEAVESLPVRVLLTLGGVIPIDAVPVPTNVTVRDFVAHDMVLPHMTAIVCHGGLSTITSALAAGVPLICIPQGRDQHFNAARVAASGVGRVVGPESIAGEIATAVRAVISDTSAREAARRFAAEIATLGGGEQATAEVEQLAGSAIHQPYRGGHHGDR
jgi:MGT family glycosyltransferase